jgi:hypothetical protein
MDELQGWFNANGLILNTETTTAMLFHSKQERDFMELQIQFGKIEIAYKSDSGLKCTYKVLEFKT